MTERELLPCPFCGGEAERLHIDEGENAGGSCIACTRCQASSNVEFEFKANFVSNWNRRASPRGEPTEAAASGLRPKVLAFAHLMEAKLRQNDYKGGWSRMTLPRLMQRLGEESAELQQAIDREPAINPPANISWRTLAANEAADVANFAMMVADRCGGLDDTVCADIAAHPARAEAPSVVGALRDEVERVVGDAILASAMLGLEACDTVASRVEAGLKAAALRDPAVEAILAALSTLQAAQDGQGASPDGWQPIETAPKDGTRVIGFTKFGVEVVKWHEWDGAEYGPRTGWIGVEQDSTCYPAGYLRATATYQPTHWMPLPPAPTPADAPKAGEEG